MKKKIIWGHRLLTPEEQQEVACRLTNIYVDSNSSMVNFVMGKGMQIEQVTITMERAIEIGFINPNAIIEYSKVYDR